MSETPGNILNEGLDIYDNDDIRSVGRNPIRILYPKKQSPAKKIYLKPEYPVFSDEEKWGTKTLAGLKKISPQDTDVPDYWCHHFREFSHCFGGICYVLQCKNEEGPDLIDDHDRAWTWESDFPKGFRRKGEIPLSKNYYLLCIDNNFDEKDKNKGDGGSTDSDKTVKG